jgi:hypothetical protein
MRGRAASRRTLQNPSRQSGQGRNATVKPRFPNPALLLPAMLLVGWSVRPPEAAASEAGLPPFKALRYDEDYTFLSDAGQRTNLASSIKYIPIAGGRTGFLSVGGEARERFETYENELFSNDEDADNAYFLQRYLLHLDYHLTEWVRAFGQLQSSLEVGRPGGPRPTDEDTIDVHQLFVDLALKLADGRQFTLRAGRQEMLYGSERLISVREGPNNRRAFDAARILYKQGQLSVDAFFSSPVEVDRDAFDDQNIRDLWFWGSYATVPLASLPGIKMDFYYLGLHNPDAIFAQGAGREERHTLGTRFFGKVGHWDFNHEAMYQFGRFDSGDINAWSVATDHGYTLENVWGKPRLGLKAAIASGDSGTNSANLQTLNPLFPRGNYFTEAALLGPQNFFDAHPSVRLQPAEKWTADLGADFYWRESLNDGIYNPGGNVIYGGDRNFSRFVGTDLSLVIGWEATRHLKISAAYTHFFAGRFVRQNDGEDVNYGAVWAAYKF